jgi:hypothetical protein
MGPIEFVTSWYHSTFYYVAGLLLVWLTVLYYIGSNVQKILRSEGSSTHLLAFVITLITILYIGLRPMGAEFGDMIGYANYYNNVPSYLPVNLHTEWLWSNMQVFLKGLGFNVHEFFFFVALVYFGCMFICSAILMRNSLWVAMIFFMFAFQTYTYGVNGMRNGFACSMVLVALCLIIESGPRRIVGFIIMLLALCVHRSSMLPTAAGIATLYFIKDTKWALRFWLASIAISLAMGPLVEAFFASLGFDDRFSSYQQGQYSAYNQSIFSHTGFRWDFLLYSSFPVAMIWYVTEYRKFSSPQFTMFANSYLLCNAFWIMVIRAAFSNRFAYLSWFLYPVVMAYPLLRMNLWKDQDRKTAIVTFLYTGFTFFMFFIYYFGTTGFKGFDQYWWK